MVEDYISRAEAYLTGDCVKRERYKVIKAKRYKTSTNDLFDKQWNKYTSYFLDETSIRWALMDDSQVKTFNCDITITRHGVRFNYQPVDYCPALEGRKFIISVLPTNLSKMDLYATEDFIDSVTGASYERGQYVTTLVSMRDLPAAERQQLVFKGNNQKKQLARKLKEKLLETALLQFPDLIPIVNTFITVDGKALDVRKQLLAKMHSITEHTPLNSIADFIRTECTALSEDKSTTELTYEEANKKGNDSLDLTIEGEDWEL